MGMQDRLSSVPILVALAVITKDHRLGVSAEIFLTGLQARSLKSRLAESVSSSELTSLFPWLVDAISVSLHMVILLSLSVASRIPVILDYGPS